MPPRIVTVVVNEGLPGAKGDPGTNIYVQPGDPGTVPDGTLWLDTDDPGPPSPTNWGNITGTLTDQTDLATALNDKAPLASPALTGTPTAPTAAPGTNTTQLATTAFVLANGGSSSPLTTKGDLYGRGASADARVPVGADGQVLVADSSQAAGVRYGSPAPPFLEMVSGGVYSSFTHGNMAGTYANVNLSGFLLTPFWVPTPTTFSRMSINVTTAAAAGTTARLGIFTVDLATGVATLVLDAGTALVDTTGQKNYTINQQLTGQYWLGYSSPGVSISSCNNLQKGLRHYTGQWTQNYGTAGTNTDYATTGFPATVGSLNFLFISYAPLIHMSVS